MAQLTAVILAAGEAKRMRSARPKVLHSLCGRPLIAYPVNAARAVGARVVVVVGRGGDEVRAAIDPEAGAGFVEQKERLGTGHAVLQAHVACGDAPGTILVLPGDCPLLSAATFIAVLWTIGGALTVQLGGLVITIPGFLVIAAVVYAIAASGFMTVIGKRFIAVAENKNQAEAEYRYALTRLRENGESIALLHGEEEERNALDSSFRNVLRGWRNICIQNMRTTIVSQTSSYIAPVLPIILCAPKFLEGSMSLGQVMQAASAFTIVQAAFNWLVDNYPRLAEWGASARRVASLEMSLDTLDRAETGFGLIDRGEGGRSMMAQP